MSDRGKGRGVAEDGRCLEWTADLELGVAEVDHEHRQWFALVRRFLKAQAEGRSHEVVYRALVEAILYTESHFASEMAVMRAAGYPGADAHERLHAWAWRKIHAYTEGSVPEEVICAELGQFLPQWLFTHIQSADRVFADWLRGRGAADAANATGPALPLAS